MCLDCCIFAHKTNIIVLLMSKPLYAIFRAYLNSQRVTFWLPFQKNESILSSLFASFFL